MELPMRLHLNLKKQYHQLVHVEQRKWWQNDHACKRTRWGLLFKCRKLYRMFHVPQSSIEQHACPFIGCIILLTEHTLHITLTGSMFNKKRCVRS